MPASVFLSYSRDNKPIADRLFHDLGRAGLEPWIDDHIPSESRWNDVLKDRIAACDIFLLLASPEAANPSRFVVRELAEAERLGKKIVRALVADDGLPVLAPWREIQMVDLRGRYWTGLGRLLADLGGQAVASPLDLIAPDRPFRAFAAAVGGGREFRVPGTPHPFLKVPVAPSGYGMAWLVGPADDCPPADAPPLTVFFKFTGADHDDTLVEVLQHVAAAKRSPWALLVEGRKVTDENKQVKLEMPNDQPHVWADAVELGERAVREWAKGRHGGLGVYFHGPAALAFAVGSRLREMLPYEVFNYTRPSYARVFGVQAVK